MLHGRVMWGPAFSKAIRNTLAVLTDTSIHKFSGGSSRSHRAICRRRAHRACLMVSIREDDLTLN